MFSIKIAMASLQVIEEAVFVRVLKKPLRVGSCPKVCPYRHSGPVGIGDNDIECKQASNSNKGYCRVAAVPTFNARQHDT